MTLPAEPQLAADVVLVFDFIEISLFSLCNLLSQAFDEKKLKPNLRITQFPYGQIPW